MSVLAYVYGAKAPHKNGDLVNEQIRLARVYKNKLIELERARRVKVDEAVKSCGFPDLVSAESIVTAIESELESLCRAAAKANSEARSKKASVPMREAIAEVRGRLKIAREARKSARSGIWTDPALCGLLAIINNDNRAAIKKERAKCGVYWGTYLTVEDSMKGAHKGAPPRFRRWDGSGSVAVQLQHGLTVDRAMSCDDPRLRMLPDKLMIRVGSEGRAPIFAEAKMNMHRVLPRGGEIMWQKLKRTRIGTQFEWTAITTVRGGVPHHSTPRATTGAIGIDVGWRLVPGGLRVAKWTGTDGWEDELILPDKLLSRWPKSESLRSIRDIAFNQMRDVMAAWIKTIAPPDWITEDAKSLWQWKSPERLGRLWWRWKDSRFDGDGDTFERLRAWRKQDRHLWNWAASNVVKASRDRLNIYRNFAAKISARYEVSYIEDTDWAKLNRKPKPEESADDDVPKRMNFRVAAVGELLQCLRHKMRVVEVPAQNTTRECAACGKIGIIGHGLNRICEGCGAVADQDTNAAAVILARGLVIDR